MSGSCLCGGVQYRVTGEPESCFHCFCQHCQANAGGPVQTCAKFRKENVCLIKGGDLIREWVLKDTVSGSPKHKVFCGRCGCTLWTIPMRHGGSHLIVRVSLIENGLARYSPTMKFFANRMLASGVTSDAPKSFTTMPGMTEASEEKRVE